MKTAFPLFALSILCIAGCVRRDRADSNIRDAEDFVVQCDRDHDGTLIFSEFSECSRSVKLPSSVDEERLREIFNRYDLNHDNRVSSGEIKDVIARGFSGAKSDPNL